jgi:hypothetical protein
MLANCRRLGGVMGGPDPRAGAGEDVTLGYGVYGKHLMQLRPDQRFHDPAEPRLRRLFARTGAVATDRITSPMASSAMKHTDTGFTGSPHRLMPLP